jgi:hypothetical protein
MYVYIDSNVAASRGDGIAGGRATGAVSQKGKKCKAEDKTRGLALLLYEALPYYYMRP